MSDSTVARAHSRVAILSRHHRDDPEQIEEARRDLKAAKLAAYIARVVAEAPPLSDEQRTRLALLLKTDAA